MWQQCNSKYMHIQVKIYRYCTDSGGKHHNAENVISVILTMVWMWVPDWLVWVFRNLMISWEFHTQGSLSGTEWCYRNWITQDWKRIYQVIFFRSSVPKIALDSWWLEWNPMWSCAVVACPPQSLMFCACWHGFVLVTVVKIKVNYYILPGSGNQGLFFSDLSH